MKETIKDIPLGELHPFPDHPFGVRDDESMEQTVESIREYGVLVLRLPDLVRTAAMRLSQDTDVNTPASLQGLRPCQLSSET